MIAVCLKLSDRSARGRPAHGRRRHRRAHQPAVRRRRGRARVGPAVRGGLGRRRSLAVTAGPAEADAVLRERAGRGAARAVRVDAAGGPARRGGGRRAGRRRSRGADLVWCGDQTSRPGSGSVPVLLAAQLGRGPALGLVEVRRRRTAAGAGRLGVRAPARRRPTRAARRSARPAVLSVEGAAARLRRRRLPGCCGPSGDDRGGAAPGRCGGRRSACAMGLPARTAPGPGWCRRRRATRRSTACGSLTGAGWRRRRCHDAERRAPVVLDPGGRGRRASWRRWPLGLRAAGAGRAVTGRPLGERTWPDGGRATGRCCSCRSGRASSTGPTCPSTPTPASPSRWRGGAAARLPAPSSRRPWPTGPAASTPGSPARCRSARTPLDQVLVELGRSADHFGRRRAGQRPRRQRRGGGRAVEAPGGRGSAGAAVVAPRVPGGDAHAGRTETSLLLAIAPDLVRLDAGRSRAHRPAGGAAPGAAGRGRGGGQPQRRARRSGGRVGRRGRALLAALVADLVAAVAADGVVPAGARAARPSASCSTPAHAGWTADGCCSAGRRCGCYDSPWRAVGAYRS